MVMVNIYPRCWLAGLGLCLGAAAGQAQNLDYLDLSLEQLLNTPITGSTLTEETLATVPAAVSVYTREQINSLGLDYLHELLNLVPGFQSSRNANSGAAYTYSARGRRTTQQSVEVLLVIDGKVVNDPRAGSPDIALPLYPLARIERVEIIRGPGSALYGSSAFTGVINIVTRRQQQSLAVGAGSPDRRQLQAFASQALGNWQADMHLLAAEDKGDRYTLPDSFSQEPLAVRDPRRQWAADLVLSRQQTRAELSFNQLETSDFYQSDNTAPGFNANQRRWWHFALEQGFQWLPNTQTQVALNYQQFSYHFDLYLAGPGALAPISNPSSQEPFMGRAWLEGESWRLTMNNDSQLDAQYCIHWGLQYSRHQETRADSQGNYDLQQLIQGQIPITYYGDDWAKLPIGTEQGQTNLGLYGQYQRQLRASTRLTLGGRYDEYPDIAGRFSPRLGLVEQLGEHYSLKLLYGEAFRAPSLSELGLINNPLLVGNPELTHEIVKTWDLIFLANWRSSQLSLGLFHNRYQQPIETVFTGEGVRTYGNSNSEQSQGIELEWLQQLNPQWSLRSSYSQMALPGSAFREAEQTASLQLNYTQGRWQWHLLGFYQGQRQAAISDTQLQTLDSVTILNTRLGYQLPANYRISLQIKNLTNQTYATPAQSLGKPQGIPHRGREWYVELAWGF